VLRSQSPSLLVASINGSWSNNLKTTVLAQIQLRALQGAGVDCSGLVKGGICDGCVSRHLENICCCVLLQAPMGSKEIMRRNESIFGKDS